MKKGKFFSIEGCEGAGKSTQAKLLAESLASEGYEVLLTREPGGTAIGEKIREILLDRNHPELNPHVELLLYLASRSQLVSEVIKPALEAGKLVITDRFHHSTLAYQGGARSLDLDLVRRMNDFATGGILPDITFLLDLPPEVGMRRKGARKEVDRMEGEGKIFHEKVRQAFLKLAGKEPNRILVLDARKPVAELSLAIKRHALDLLRSAEAEENS
ncbi:MAG TPA: dTMP kinase [archaeon]|nr:dTMP kinase [archaeon]